MKNIREEVHSLAIVAARTLGAMRVSEVLKQYDADHILELTVRQVDGFLAKLKKAVDEKESCNRCEAPSPPANCGTLKEIPDLIDFEPFYNLVNEAHRILGNKEATKIICRYGGLPSTMHVHNVNSCARELRKAMAENAPVRKELKEYLSSHTIVFGSLETLESFAAWLDKRWVPSQVQTTVTDKVSEVRFGYGPPDKGEEGWISPGKRK